MTTMDLILDCLEWIIKRILELVVIGILAGAMGYWAAVCWCEQMEAHDERIMEMMMEGGSDGPSC